MLLVAVVLGFTIVIAGEKFPARLAFAERRHLLVGYGARPDKPDLITGA
jgi:hypothetical protein